MTATSPLNPHQHDWQPCPPARRIPGQSLTATPRSQVGEFASVDLHPDRNGGSSAPAAAVTSRNSVWLARSGVVVFIAGVVCRTGQTDQVQLAAKSWHIGSSFVMVLSCGRYPSLRSFQYRWRSTLLNHGLSAIISLCQRQTKTKIAHFRHRIGSPHILGAFHRFGFVSCDLSTCGMACEASNRYPQARLT